MTKSPWQSFLTQTAEGAGKVLLKYFRKTLQISIKRGAGIVTDADTAAEEFILKRIRKQFPESSVIAEESGESMGSGEYCWILDPLDGTTNFAHGFPFFCVSIGLYRGKEAVAGVVYHPVSGECFFAEKGKGAFLGKTRLHVSKVKKMSMALFGTGFYYAKGKQLSDEMHLFHRVNEEVLGVRRPGAAALDLAYVAAGRYDGFWERGLSPWDVAAGYLLITEAGGKISDYTGKPTTIFSKEVLATNRLTHSNMVRLLTP